MAKTISLKITGVSEDMLLAVAIGLGYSRTVEKRTEKVFKYTRTDYESGSVVFPENCEGFLEKYLSGSEEDKQAENLEAKYTEVTEVSNPQTISAFYQQHFTDHYIAKHIKPVAVNVLTAQKKVELEGATQVAEETLSGAIGVSSTIN